MNPSKYQQAIALAFDDLLPGGTLQISATAGSGKCLGAGTPIMRFDGTVVPVEQIREGDLLMGPDSKPRQVLTTNVGAGELFRITPVKGASWICNAVHILTLAGTNRFKGQTIDIALNDYLKRCEQVKSFQHDWKLWRTGVDFAPQFEELPIEPYLCGLWLGDGTTSGTDITTPDPELIEYLEVTAQKYGLRAKVTDGKRLPLKKVSLTSGTNKGRHGRNPLRNVWLSLFHDFLGRKTIPHSYLTASRQERLELLAGIIDTDGYIQEGCEIISQHEHLANQYKFLARSLGFAAHSSEKPVQLKGWNKPRIYYRVTISGDLSVVPCLIKRKQSPVRKQIKNVGVTGFSVEPIGNGFYYGFTLDQDGRFLLGDFTVTHNTSTLKMLLGMQSSRVLQDTLMCAFNKSISDELSKKVPSETTVKTIHGLGYSALSNVFGKLPSPYAKKYRDLFDLWINQNLSFEKQQSTPELSEARFAFGKLADMTRVTLTDPRDREAMWMMCLTYDVALPEPEIMLEAIALVLEWGAGIVPAPGARDYSPKSMIDFTDMIWLPIKLGLRPKQYGLVLTDESQDLSRAQLELVLSACKPDGRKVFVGDACQPTGTLVQTPNGLKPIEQLEVGECVVSYERRSVAFIQKGREILGITKREFQGDLICVKTATGQTTRYTPNHICFASLKPLAHKYVVYLMRRGNQYRVGCCQMAYGAGQFGGPVMRMRQERADALWILSVHDSKQAALIEEGAICGVYGLPQVTFYPVNAGSVLNAEALETLWLRIGSNERQAITCLEAYKRDFRYPLCDRTTDSRFGVSRPILVKAINLLPGMKVMTYGGYSHPRGDQWTQIEVTRQPYNGFVYSMAVAKDEMYIGDGILTHNCQAIYGFAGADAHAFDRIGVRTNAQQLPLSICYRCASSVIAVAKRLVPQIEAAPNAPEGLVEVVSEKFFTENVMVQDMILCRLTAPLVAMAFWLIRGGKRAKVKGRDIGAALRKVIDEVESLKNSSWETFDQNLEQWRANQLRVAQNRADAEMLTISINDKADSVLAVWDEALRAGAVSIAQLRVHLEDLFSDDERGVILLSTIHRAKGLEAETVYLLAPEKVPHPMAKSPDAMQQEKNLVYVATTRAMRRFYVVETPGKPLTSFWNALLNPQKELDLEVTK